MSFPGLLGLDTTQRPAAAGPASHALLPTTAGLPGPLPGPQNNELGYLEGLAKSTLSSATSEFVGLEPWEGVEGFREEHPISSIGSQIVGFGAPYLALGGVGGMALKTVGAASKIPVLARTAGFLADPLVASTRPIAKAAVQEMIRFAPVEAARLGLAAMVGDPRKVAEQAPLNLALTGIFGGIFRGVPAALRGTFPRQGLTPGSGTGTLPFAKSEGVVMDRIADYNINDPPQLKWRKLQEYKRNVPDMDDELKLAIDETLLGHGGDRPSPGLRGTILTARPVKGHFPLVRTMESPLADNRALSPYFEFGSQKGRKVQGLFKGANGFSKDDLPIMEKALEGMPEGWEGYMYTPRIVTFEGDKAANNFRNTVFGLQNVKKGVWMGREADDGFFVVARKIQGRAEPPRKGPVEGKPKATMGREKDSWLIYKTDQPGFIDADLAAYDGVIRRELWGRYYEDMSDIESVASGMKFQPVSKAPGGRGALIGPVGFWEEKVAVDTFRPQPGGGTLKMTEKVGIQDIPLGKAMKELEEAMPGTADLALVPITERSGYITKALMRYNPAFAQSYAGVVNTAENAFKRVLSPLTTQFSKSPALLRSLHLTQAMIGKATSKAVDEWVGVREQLATPMKAIWGKAKVIKDGPKAIFDKMDDDDLLQLSYVQAHPELSTAWMQKQDWIPERVKTFLSAMDKVDRKNHYDLNRSRALNGEDPLPYQPWHFGITRRLHLPLKMPVVVEKAGVYNGVKFNAGDVLDVVDGTTRGQVQHRAQEVIDFVHETTGIKANFNLLNMAGEEQIGKVGPDAPTGSLQWVLEQAHGMVPEQQKLLVQAKAGKTPIPGDPARALPSMRAVGRFSFLRPMRRKEMENQIFGSILEMNSWTVRNILTNRLGYDLAHATRRWPGMTAQALDRMAKLHGARGPVTQMQDTVVDQFLAPLFGPRVATRTVRAINNGMHALTLGFFDVAHPALNAVTFLQTVMPEVAFVTRVPKKSLLGLYEHDLVAAADGKSIPVSYLSAAGMMGRAFKQMWSKDPEILADVKWAGEQGLLGPRFAEGILNDLDEKIGYKMLSTGAESFADWLGSVLKYMPAKSEELSRLHGFLAGRIVWGDVLGLKGNQLRLASAQFARRTMYDYAQGSTPQVLTGPMGQFMGLFRNWQFNYLANLRGYSAEALKGNMAPLLWAGAGSAAVGGAAAMPLWFMAEAASKVFANQSAMESLYEMTGYKDRDDFSQLGIDTAYYGAPWALFSLSLQGRAEAPGANAVRDFTQLADSVTLQRMGYLKDAIGEMWDAYSLAGVHPGNYRKGRDLLIRATAPRTAYRAVQAVGTEGIRSLITGNQISPAVSPLEKMAFVMGFTPRDVQKSNDLVDISMSDSEKRRKTTQIYGDIAADYAHAHDYRGLNSTLQQASRVEGLSLKSVMRSAQSRLAKRDDPSVNRNFDRYRQQILKEKLGYKGE